MLLKTSLVLILLSFCESKAFTGSQHANSRFKRANESENANSPLSDLFQSAFGGTEGQNLLRRFQSIFGRPNPPSDSDLVGSFFRDKVFENLIEKAQDLNSDLATLRRNTQTVGTDLTHIKNMLDRGGSATRILHMLRRNNIPRSLSLLSGQRNRVDQINRDFLKFIQGMNALRSAFSNEQALGETLSKLFSQSGSGTSGPPSSTDVSQNFNRLLRILRGEQIGDFSFRDIGWCTNRYQCESVDRGLKDLRRIFQAFSSLTSEDQDKTTRPPAVSRSRTGGQPANRTANRPSARRARGDDYYDLYE